MKDSSHKKRNALAMLIIPSADDGLQPASNEVGSKSMSDLHGIRLICPARQLPRGRESTGGASARAKSAWVRWTRGRCRDALT